jgi:TonB family protein
MSATRAALVCVLMARSALAQDAAPPDAPEAPPPESFERPTLVEDSPPRYPEAAWKARQEADVVVLLTVDEQGQVSAAEVVTPAGEGFDEEALRAARKLRFAPARLSGVPTAVKIRYTFRFRIPEKETVAQQPACADAACPGDPRRPARLTMTVYERGKGKPMPKVEVYLLDRDQVYLTDDEGRLTLELEPGAWAITIRPPEFYEFETIERLDPGETLEVKYFVRRHRRARYTTIVWGTEGRAEVARTSLVDDEIRAIPGTMGDPLRVTMLLPGVAASVSGLGYPIVRGSLPGDSMYEVDGIPVPMLYHLLFGTAVIHPRFTDEIVFQPGGYSAEHGRFPGGRIAATTAKVGDDPLWAAELSIVQGSLFRADKIGRDSDVVVAARYGTLGYIIEGIASDVVFRYWDYQARAQHRFDDGGRLTLTLLGVADAAGEINRERMREEVLRVGFHRADLRYRKSFGAGWLTAGAQGGYEFFDPPPPDDDPSEEDELDQITREKLARPYLEAGYGFSDKLELRGGADVLYQRFGLDLPELAAVVFRNPDTGVTAGAWLSLEWELGRLLLNPSLRADLYRYSGDGEPMSETAVDPRLALSYELTPGLRLKASGGLYSGPPRFSFVEPPIVFGPIPGFGGLGLEYGLNRTVQAQAGVESDLPGDLQVAATGFFHDVHSSIDFGLLDKPLTPDTTPCDGDTPGFVAPLDVDGKSYGAELLLRRRLGQAFFGWISYAVSRSERTVAGVGTFPTDFDQTHVLNAVLSWDVGRNWTLGTVFHFNTGRPVTPFRPNFCGSEEEELQRGVVNSQRLPNYWRLDLRVQKREVFETWFFDFYIDFFNVAFQWETIGYEWDEMANVWREDQVPLFLPMVGIRGEF